MTSFKIIQCFILFCVFSILQVPSQGCSGFGQLGMQNGRIKDSQITTSSVLKGTTAYGKHARLRKNITQWGAWCPEVSGGSRTERNYDQYIQIDLVNLTIIRAIATQGREHAGGREWVEYYKISYRRDGGVWNYYQGKTQTAKILKGNTDVKNDKFNAIDPAIIARYIRVHPGYYTGNPVCMRLELYGDAPAIKEGILFYSVPVGHSTDNGNVTYHDTPYNGVTTKGVLKDGTGILTDGKFGPDDAKQDKGEGWVGWSQEFTTSPYIDITFEFSDVRMFKNVTLTVNADKKRGYAVFSRSKIFFALAQDNFIKAAFLQFYPRNFADNNSSNSTRHITLPLCENTARFIKLRLYFGGRWLLITEISFNSASTNENGSSFQSCVVNTPTAIQPSTTSSPLKPSNATSASTSECSDCANGTKEPANISSGSNNLQMTIVIICVILLIAILLLVIMFLLYRRRALCFGKKKQSKKDKNPVSKIPMGERSPDAQDQGTQNNDATPYEEVSISPQSIYAELNRNREDEKINEHIYQKLLKPRSGYVIPVYVNVESPYEEVKKKNSLPICT